MNILKTTTLLLVVALFTSCQSKGDIYGIVKGADKLLLLESLEAGLDTLETVVPGAEGGFSVAMGEREKAGLFFLSASKEFAVPLFWQPGENIKVTVSKMDEGAEPEYEIEGSPESARIRKITKIVDDGFERVDSLNQASQLIKGTPEYVKKRPALDSIFQSIVDDAAQQYKEMSDKEPGSIANIFIFSQRFGNVPIISVQENFDYLEKVANGLQERYPDLEITENFVKNTEEAKKNMVAQEQMKNARRGLKEGSPVPEIALTSPTGETKKLSDLRGKVVLVDFWAAWCRPCRIENPNLVRMYEEYQGDGFEIYSVSLDGLPQQQNPKEEWMGAIQQDGLTWSNHVSQLQGWNSSVVQEYGFQGIPFTVLVGRDGNVIATELRGTALENKLKEVLGES